MERESSSVCRRRGCPQQLFRRDWALVRRRRPHSNVGFASPLMRWCSRDHRLSSGSGPVHLCGRAYRSCRQPTHRQISKHYGLLTLARTITMSPWSWVLLPHPGSRRCLRLRSQGRWTPFMQLTWLSLAPADQRVHVVITSPSAVERLKFARQDRCFVPLDRVAGLSGSRTRLVLLTVTLLPWQTPW